MEKEVQERFERIERNMERFSQGMIQFGDGMNQLRQAHIELEASQLNTNKSIDRLSAKVEDLTEQLNNTRILVDQLLKRDLGQ